jgi:hypothetical protein
MVGGTAPLKHRPSDYLMGIILGRCKTNDIKAPKGYVMCDAPP